MTENEIRREMDFLEKMLGSWHNQINAIAQREANATIFQHPVPYENRDLQEAKENLIKKSSEVLEILKKLHDLLVGPRRNT